MVILQKLQIPKFVVYFVLIFFVAFFEGAGDSEGGHNYLWFIPGSVLFSLSPLTNRSGSAPAMIVKATIGSCIFPLPYCVSKLLCKNFVSVYLPSFFDIIYFAELVCL